MNVVVLTSQEANLIDHIALTIPADILDQHQWEILSGLSARIIGAR